jgi:hypothetical protein
MHNSCIVLDFDHTVFNTTKLVAAWKDCFERDFGIAPEVFMAHRETIKACNTVIDLEHFAASFDGQDPKALRAALHQTIADHAGTWTFDDVVPFINTYKPNFDITIETHGDTVLQTEKITHSGVPRDIPFIVSTENKALVVGTILETYDHVIFIDDKPENISEVKDAHGSNVTTYFIARPEDMPYSGQDFTCDCADYNVASLSEIELKLS